MTTDNPAPTAPFGFAGVLKAVAGATILLVVAMLAYGVVLIILDLIPLALLFPSFLPVSAISVILASIVGMWCGAAALKTAFPSVARRVVLPLVAVVIGIGLAASVALIAMQGIGDQWDGALNGVAFLVSAYYLLREGWDDLPGRKATPPQDGTATFGP